MSSAIFLHVGPHKTGSTAVQKALRKCRGRLLQNGVLFPKAGMAGMGHHDLVNFLRERPNDFDRAAFDREVGEHPLSLISSENIVMLDPKRLERLRDMLPSRDVTIVFYLRRLVDLWSSHWQAVIRHGSSMTFPEYVALASMTMKSQNAISVIDQLKQLDNLADVFGRQAIRVVGYDVLRESKADFAADLVRRVSPAAADAVDVKTGEANVSIPIWTVELLRAVNQVHHEEAGSRASAALRMAVVRDLADGKIEFGEEFADFVAEHSSERAFREQELVLKLLQDRVLDAYGDLIQGDRQATIDAYTRATGRTMQVFRFPIGGVKTEAIRTKLLAYYRSLPETALAKDPPRLKRRKKGGGKGKGKNAASPAEAAA